MNVVLVNDFAQINGGASKVALGSARALALRGHRVHLLAGVGPVDASLQSVRNLSVVCLNQHDLLGNPNRLSAAMQGVWNKSAAAHMKAVLDGLHPEDTVVHVHMWGKALSSSVVRAASDLGFKIILTLHDYLAVCPTGTLFQHPTQSICTIKPMSAQCIASNCDARSYGHKLWRVGRQVAQAVPGKLPSGIDKFIAISPLCKSIMERHLPPGSNIDLVENPVEMEQEPPVEVHQNSHFVFLGRLAAEKGPVLFAQATKDANVEALLIGDGEMRGKVREANSTALITGWKSSSAARALLKSARAIVFPSLWQETQGLVVAEALALGIPAIVSDVSGARDWIDDGISGITFRSGDKDDLTAKILLLRDRPAEAARIGRKAYENYWAQPPTLARHVSALESIYSSLIATTVTA
jgi:glycosyltransferase involved in cell wall biosynthesis